MSPLVRQSGRDPVSQDPGPRGTHFGSSPGSLAGSGVVEERGGAPESRRFPRGRATMELGDETGHSAEEN